MGWIATSSLDRMYPHLRFIQSYVHNGRIGVLVEFGLETWLVTKAPEFLDLSRGVAMHAAAANPESLDTLLEQSYVKDPAITVEKALAAGSTLLGERISATRFVRWNNDPQRSTEPPTPPKAPATAKRQRRA